MKITKFLHSCVLVQEGDVRVLVDPGRFTFIDGQITPARFGRLDAVVITHHHPDHVDPGALADIVERTGAIVVGNQETAGVLGEQGFEVTVVDRGEYLVGNLGLTAIPADHEPILDDAAPRNTAYLIGGRFLHCGDSFSPGLFAYRDVEVLGVAVTAPFLTEIAVMGFIAQMRPGAVLPLHDGFVKDYFRHLRYDDLRPYVEGLGITLHTPYKIGDTIDLPSACIHDPSDLRL